MSSPELCPHPRLLEHLPDGGVVDVLPGVHVPVIVIIIIIIIIVSSSLLSVIAPARQLPVVGEPEALLHHQHVVVLVHDHAPDPHQGVGVAWDIARVLGICHQKPLTFVYE